MTEAKQKIQLDEEVSVAMQLLHGNTHENELGEDALSAVFIGRFQPVHHGHIKVMKHTLEHVDQLIVVLGSDKSARTTRNPFTSAERALMIYISLKEAGVDTSRVKMIGVPDLHYHPQLWEAQVQNKVHEIAGKSKVIMTGRPKDATSSYLQDFPTWQRMYCPPPGEYNATDARRAMFTGKLDDAAPMLSKGVLELLREWANKETFLKLKEEWNAEESFKASWANAPFPPVFVTTDALIIRSGHILAIRRPETPGKGLYALPGGFLRNYERADEEMIDSCIHHLKAKTGLSDLFYGRPWANYLNGTQVYAHPLRSQRGRTVTHVFTFDLGIGDMPKLKNGDWIPVIDALANPQSWFEDHHTILQSQLLTTSNQVLTTRD